jgi:hypothetical protein
VEDLDYLEEEDLMVAAAVVAAGAAGAALVALAAVAAAGAAVDVVSPRLNA